VVDKLLVLLTQTPLVRTSFAVVFDTSNVFSY